MTTRPISASVLAAAMQKAMNTKPTTEKPKQAELPPFETSALRISTMCTTCETGRDINYPAFFTHVQIMPYYLYKEGCLKTKLLKETRGVCDEDIREQGKKTQDQTPVVPKGKNFLHQTTVIYRVKTGPATWKEVNVKVFKNGSLQMSGVSSIDIAQRAQELVIADLNSANRLSGGLILGEGKPDLVTVPIDISLINSDFSVSFLIRREVLREILDSEYKMHAEFESTGYQGVKVAYMWNSEYTNQKKFPYSGTCYCDDVYDIAPCTADSKGTGHGKGQCRCVTIAIFQTGKVIITGARSHDQLMDVYNYILNMLRTKMATIYRHTLGPVTLPQRKRNKILSKNVQYIRPEFVVGLCRAESIT